MESRLARAEDAAAVCALWSAAYADAGPEGRREPYAEAEFFVAAEEGEMRVVEADGGAVVAVVVYRAPGTGGAVATAAEAELSRLAVAEAARRRGIGRTLVEDCVERARADAAAALVLWSRPYQTDAHRLYEMLGFRQVPARDDRDPEGRRLAFALDLA